MQTTAAPQYTTGQVGRLLNVPEWRISSLYKRGLLPEPQRFGPYRMLTEADVEACRAKLIEAGVIKPAAAQA